ncbi:MAG: acyl-CoA dehydrogenase, partial [Betaproteobacteria bacterium]|nr:acyl-CoA dehydrogenase [Betaproteobacteria bacterium]
MGAAMNESIDRGTLELFAASVQRYGQQQYSFERRREWLASEGGFSVQAWRDQTDMGWLDLHKPVADGGFGGHLEAVCAMMRCAGEYLFLEPLFGHGILCAQLLASCATEPLARESLDQLCAGHGLYALAFCEDQPGECDVQVGTLQANGQLSGCKTLVLHGDVATQLLVLAREGAAGVQSWYLVDAAQAGVERKSYRLLDGRGTASLMFRNAVARRIGPPGAGERLLANLLGVARLALCAEAYGVILALNRMTLAYLKERRQFGKPIGANQALQHRMVE